MTASGGPRLPRTAGPHPARASAIRPSPSPWCGTSPRIPCSTARSSASTAPSAWHLVDGRDGAGAHRCPKTSSHQGVLWDFSGTSGHINGHERETAESSFAQLSSPGPASAAGHGPTWSRPRHLNDDGSGEGAAAPVGLLRDFASASSCSRRGAGHPKTASIAALPRAPARGRRCAYFRSVTPGSGCARATGPGTRPTRRASNCSEAQKWRRAW